MHTLTPIIIGDMLCQFWTMLQDVMEDEAAIVSALLGFLSQQWNVWCDAPFPTFSPKCVS